MSKYAYLAAVAVCLWYAASGIPLFAQPCQQIIWTEDFGSGSDPVGNPSPYVNNAYIFQNFGVQPGNYSTVNSFNYHASWHEVPEDHTPGDMGGYFMVIDGLDAAPEFYSIQIDNLQPGANFAFSGWAMNMDLPAFQSNLTFAFSICDPGGNELATTTTGIIPATDEPIWTQHSLEFNTAGNTSVILKLVFTATGYDDFAFDDFELMQLGTSAVTTLSPVLCPGESLTVQGVVFDQVHPSGSVTLAGASWQGCDSVINVDLSFVSLSPGVETGDLNGYQVSCYGSSDGHILLNPTGGTPPYDIIWSTGDTQPQLEGLPAGTYAATVTDNGGCSTAVTVAMTAPPPLEPIAMVESPLCFGQPTGSIWIDAPGYQVPLQFFSWYEGLFSPADSFPVTIASLDAGHYSIVLIDANGCEATIEVELPSPPELTLNLIGDTSLFFGDSLLLEAQVNFHPVTVSWSPPEGLFFEDSLHAWTVPPTTLTYAVAASNASGCMVNAQLTVYVDETRQIFVPNIFSPNDDLINDLFYCHARPGQVARIRFLRIYDRWGAMLFEAADILPGDPTAGWDGRFRGSPVQSGVFTWYMEVELAGGVVQVLKGDVSLIR